MGRNRPDFLPWPGCQGAWCPDGSGCAHGRGGARRPVQPGAWRCHQPVS